MIMVHEGCGNADFTWNEYGGGGSGGGAPPGGGAPSPGDDDDGSIELYSCEAGKFIDETLYGSWIEDMEPPNKNCNQSQNSASNEQEKLVDEKEEEELPLIGLKLTISPYFLNSLNSIFLSQETNNRNRINQHHKRDSHSHSHQRRLMVMSHPQPRHDDFLSQPSSSAAAVTEKMKASNFPTLSLKIGSWERVSIHEGDLVAKCYYAKKKLVWEFLERSLKRKIEIQWSDISAIRAIIEDNVPGILHIEVFLRTYQSELGQPPTFFDEIDPQPRKHTNWRTTQDFTGGQALLCRRHFLRFPAGVLDKHYEKLLQYDSRLFHLSQQPFPSSKYRYFPQQNENMYNFADYSINFKPEMVSPFNIHAHQQLQAYHHQQIINNPSLLNLGSPNSDHNGSMWVGNRRGFQVQGASSFAESVARDQVQGGTSNIAPTGKTGFVYQNNNNNNYIDASMFLNELENNLLTNYSNQQQQYYRENAASMDTYINLYQGGNSTCNIATNQHLTYEHNTVTTTNTMHSVNQHSMDNTALIYPPHPSISWVAQPVSMAMPPQSMAQAVSVAAPPQNMAQAMSLPVSMVALPQHMEEEMAVNLPKSNSFDQMMIDDIGTMNGNNVANNNWQV